MGFVKLQLVAKYENKIKGGPLGDLKKILNEIFEQCHSAEKCKRGDPLGFFDINCVAKYRNKRRETLWWNPKTSKKSRTMPKKIRLKNTKGETYVFEVVYVDIFVLDELLAFRVCFGGP